MLPVSCSTPARTTFARACLFAAAAAFACAAPGTAWSTPILGSAQDFTLLASATVTNTGPSAIAGDVGVAPGTAATGFDSVALAGTLHLGDAAAAQAQRDGAAANTYLRSLAFTRDLSGLDLGGMTLTAGVYRFSSSAQLTGALVLDAQHQANALFVFQIGSTLTSASAASVQVINGAADTGLFFDVGTAAVLGAGSAFAGNLIAADSITFNTGARLLCGRALALGGAVTLDTSLASNDCGGDGAFGSGATDFGSAGFSGVALAAVEQDVPEPASVLLLPAGLVALAWTRRRRGSAPV